MPRATVLPINGNGSRAQVSYGPRSVSPGYSLLPPSSEVTGPARPLGSRVSSERARLRRRNVLLALVGAAVLTLAAAVGAGGMFIVLHLLFDAMLLGYVLLLVQYQREIDIARTEQRQVIAGPAHAYAATGTGSH
jgi:hypothetical protein